MQSHDNFAERTRLFKENPRNPKFRDMNPVQMARDRFDIATMKREVFIEPWWREQVTQQFTDAVTQHHAIEQWVEDGQTPYCFLKEPVLLEDETPQVAYLGDYNNFDNVGEMAVAIRADGLIDTKKFNDLQLRMSILTAKHWRYRYNLGDQRRHAKWREWMNLEPSVVKRIMDGASGKTKAAKIKEGERRVQAQRDLLFKCICNEIFECEPEEFPGTTNIHLYDLIPRKGSKPPDPKEVVEKSIVGVMQCLHRGSEGGAVLNHIQAQRRHAQKRASTTQDKEKAEQEKGRDEQLGSCGAQDGDEKDKKTKIAKSYPGAKAAATIIAAAKTANIAKG